MVVLRLEVCGDSSKGGAVSGLKSVWEMGTVTDSNHVIVTLFLVRVA